MAKQQPTVAPGRVSRETTDAAAMGPLGFTPPVAGGPEADPNDGLSGEEGGTGVDRDGRPYCMVHNCVMVAAGSREGRTYYKCKVANCDETAKRLRGRVPREPLICEQRICIGRASALVVVPERSSIGQLLMRCPRCGIEVTVPHPSFGEAHDAVKRRGPEAEDLGAR